MTICIFGVSGLADIIRAYLDTHLGWSLASGKELSCWVHWKRSTLSSPMSWFKVDKVINNQAQLFGDNENCINLLVPVAYTKTNFKHTIEHFTPIFLIFEKIDF